VQAIQSIENAAPEVLSCRSPFRALVWKEWRQQRWIFFSLAGLAYALLVSAFIVYRTGYIFNFNREAENAAGVLCGIAAFLGIVGIVVLSANAFAGEREDDTDQFLATIPCSMSKLFWVKLGLVLSLVLLELIPLLVVGFIANVSEFNDGGHAVNSVLFVLSIAAVVLVLVTVPALVASFGGSVIATILASIPVIAACWAYTYSAAVSAAMLVRFLPIKSYTIAISLAVSFIILVFATILLAAWRMWTRPEGTWRSSLRTAAATAGLLIAYVAVPVAAVYLYVTCFAPLSFYLAGNGRNPSASVSSVSPDGKSVTFNAYYGGWGSNAYRAALTNVDSGRTRWLTRFRDSFVWPVSRFWSPSGNQFVLDETDRWLWPLARETARPVTYFVVDARSGEKHGFAELCPGSYLPSTILSLVGWYSEHVFALSNTEIIFFADIERHQVKRCGLPAGDLNGRFSNPFQLSITRRGIFAAHLPVSAKGELRLLRFAPDLEEAESLTVHSSAGTSPGIEASTDGQWLLVNDFEGSRTRNVWRLARLTNGAEAALLVSDHSGEKGLIPPLWHVKAFLPGGHQILLYGEGELGLFDADSHDLRRIPLAQASVMNMNIASVQLSPAGGFALVGLGVPVESRHIGTPIVIVDLRTGASLTLWTPSEANRIGPQNVRWLGEDRLLCERNNSIVIINRDGTGARPLFTK
jgi:hypothetical protein